MFYLNRYFLDLRTLSTMYKCVQITKRNNNHDFANCIFPWSRVLLIMEFWFSLLRTGRKTHPHHWPTHPPLIPRGSVFYRCLSISEVFYYPCYNKDKMLFPVNIYERPKVPPLVVTTATFEHLPRCIKKRPGRKVLKCSSSPHEKALLIIC